MVRQDMQLLGVTEKDAEDGKIETDDLLWKPGEKPEKEH